MKNEQNLQTAGVIRELIDKEVIAQKLVETLGALQTDKGRVMQFLRQVVHGPKDETELAKTMNELGRAKDNLALRINIANSDYV